MFESKENESATDLNLAVSCSIFIHKFLSFYFSSGLRAQLMLSVYRFPNCIPLCNHLDNCNILFNEFKFL